MRRLTLLAVVGCGSAPHPVAPPAPLPAATTACYAGVATAQGKKSRVIVRRTVDPVAHQIREDVGRDTHVVVDVTGDHFTLKEAGGQFTGTGTLSGEPWRWTSWTSSTTAAGGIVVDSDDELTATGMKATQQIRKDGTLVASTTDELKTFDCASWEQAIADLALPVLDGAACERACRNYAKLKYDAHAGGTPEDFQARLDAGLPSCIEQCVKADNAAQTACLAAAPSLEALGSCTD